MMNKPTFVLAGNRAEYDEYLESKGLPLHTRSHIFLHSEYQLRGFSEPVVVLYGTWRSRKNLHEFEISFRSRRARAVFDGPDQVPHQEPVRVLVIDEQCMELNRKCGLLP